MAKLQTYRIVIIIALFGIVGFVCIAILFNTWSARPEKKQELRSIPENATVPPTRELPSSLGVFSEEADLRLHEGENQAFELRERAPIVTADFALEYDYKTAKFVVSLAAPKEVSRQKFKTWLLENNFSGIDSSLIQYKYL